MGTNSFYTLGILLGLGSSFLDVVTNFIIRQVGEDLPLGIIPFMSGSFSAIGMVIYTSYAQPIDWFYIFQASKSQEDVEYLTAIQYALIGSILGWIALEFMVIGARITKSALTSFAEMTGMAVPFVYDGLILGRRYMMIDVLGIILIISLQIYNATKT